MAKVIRSRWITEASSGLARRDRRSCDYEAYVPDLLADRKVTLNGDTAADVADAERAASHQPRRRTIRCHGDRGTREHRRYGLGYPECRARRADHPGPSAGLP